MCPYYARFLDSRFNLVFKSITYAAITRTADGYQEFRNSRSFRNMVFSSG